MFFFLVYGVMGRYLRMGEIPRSACLVAFRVLLVVSNGVNGSHDLSNIYFDLLHSGVNRAHP
jgi:hypothetical protein